MVEVGHQIPIHPGQLAHLPAGEVGAVGCIPVNLGDPPPIILFVSADGEEEGHEYTLPEGETFPVGDQVWEVTAIDDPTTQRWTATITRVR